MRTNRLSRAAFAVGLLVAGPAIAGPFGTTMGQSVATLSGQAGSVPGVYRVKVPQPNAEFESYSAVATRESGLCKLWGTGRDHDNDRYGNDVRSAYDRLRGLLDGKYGASQEVSFIRSGALWKDADEWVMSIRQKERTVIAYWSSEKLPLPDGLVAISLEIKATSSSSAYLDLTYEFKNFVMCKERLSATTADGL